MRILHRSTGYSSQMAPAIYHTVVAWENRRVRTAVARLHEGAAEILGIAEAPLKGLETLERPDPDRWYASCAHALEQAEEMTLRSAGRKIVADHVSMAIPIGCTRNLAITDEIQRRAPQRPITREEWKHAIQRGYRRAQDRLSAEDKDHEEDIILGEVASILLDGRPVDHVIGLTGERLALKLFFILAPLEWIRTLEVISGRLGLELVTLIPHHVAYASTIQDKAALLVTVDEHLSVLDMIYQGRIAWSVRIPQGSEELLYGAVHPLAIPEHQIEALLRVYRAGQLREDIETALSKRYWEALQRWMTALAKQAQANAGESVFPSHIYAHDMTGRVPEILPAMETPFWEQCLPFARCPKVDDIDTAGDIRVLDCTAHAQDRAYLLLRCLVHYIARLYGPAGESDRIMLEMVRRRR